MFNFGRKTEETVGLDIGSHSVKVVSLKKEGEKNVLTAYNVKRVPPDAKSSDTKRLVSETLDEIDLHPEEVNLGFSGPSVIVRFIEFPKMNKEQLGNALSFEAEKYMPFSINEVVMDFIILGDAHETGKMRVLLAAAKKDLVESRVQLMEELGISINILDIDALAVFNAFSVSHEVGDKSNAFFHFGHSETDVLVTVGQTPCFMRQIQIGGKDIDAAISKDLGVSPEKASEMLKESDEETKRKVVQSTDMILEDVVREMQLSFGYYENRYNARVENVYCSGGMVFQEGILQNLASKTGYEMKKWDPMKGTQLADHILREDVDKVGMQLAVSVGLALRG